MPHLGHALRALVRRPAFAAVAILTLALGIGANAAIFSIIHATLLRALPYPDADRLLMPWEYSEEVRHRLGFDRLPASPADVADYAARQTTFASFASIRADRGVNLTGVGEPERLAAVRVGPEFFDVLRIRPVAGRLFTRGDTGRLVVISERLWARRFGGDSAIAGRTISLNGEQATIVGVVPEWFRFPAAPELPESLGFAAEPLVWTLDILTPEQRRNRGGKSYAMIGRLRDGLSAQAAETELAGIAADIARDFPASNAGWTVRTFPLREQIVGRLRPSLVVMLIAVGFVLLVACANVANLLLVRATTRSRELAVRHAIGASRGTLVAQLVMESVLLAAIAGAVGLMLGYWILKVLLVSPPASVMAITQATFEWQVVAFTALLSLVTGVAFGIWPAFHATGPAVLEALREGARGSVGSRRAHRTRSALVILEVAIALLLLIGTALLVQTFVRLTYVDTGFRTDRVLTMDIALPRSAYEGAPAAAFFDALLARLAIMPGVEAAGVTSTLPLSGSENLVLLTIEGQPRPQPGQEIIADYRVVTPGYFRALGIPLLDGDLLPERARADGPRLAVINATMARTCWGDGRAIGRRIKLAPFERDAPWYTVIGIVGDTRHTGLDTPPRPQVYVHQQYDPYEQMAVVVRTTSAPMALAPSVRAAVALIDPNQPVARMRPMAEVVAESISARRFHMVIVAGLAVLAAMLSLVGLYAVVSFSVAERLHEMAVRLALGARPANLLTLVLADGLKLAAAGIVIGIVAALALTGYLDALLYGVRARDAATFIGVSILLLLAAVLGCIVPARRAMRVDPATALRSE